MVFNQAGFDWEKIVQQEAKILAWRILRTRARGPSHGSAAFEAVKDCYSIDNRTTEFGIADRFRLCSVES
ncbi:hypothetical protein QL285_006449 [Trifolium repens]|nr:hypothetical protein QL285_006449 [Trifolium repens]